MPNLSGNVELYVIITSMLSQNIRALLLSPPFWSAVGCTVVTIPISTSGSVLFAISTIWTAINELSSGKRRVSSESADLERTGLLGFLKEKFESPGFFPFLQCLMYLWSGVAALTDLKYWHALAMLLQSAGALALERIANFVYQVPARKQLAFENLVSGMWSQVPHRVRIVLQDPGALFCLGAGVLTIVDTNLEQLRNSGLLVQFCYYGGFIVLVLAVLRGFLPLMFDYFSKESGQAIYLGGIGHLLLGVGAFSVSNPYTAVALMVWGVSNLLYGWRLDQGSKAIS